MRAVVVYMSIHKGNTRKIGEVIAERLGARIIKATEADVKDLLDYDLLGFGSGIYLGRNHVALLKLLDEFPKVQDKYAFIFSTSGLPEIPIIHDYHRALRKRLLRKGFEILGEFTCRGYSTHGPLKLFGGINKGRPNKSDLEMASGFAEQIKRIYLERRGELSDG